MDQSKELQDLLKAFKDLREDFNMLSSQMHRLVNAVIAIRQLLEEQAMKPPL
jgi:prefoldin subunit 5